MKVNLPFERIPEHANDPGFGPVPPRKGSQEAEWLDPAPGHEEQVNAAQACKAYSVVQGYYDSAPEQGWRCPDCGDVTDALSCPKTEQKPVAAPTIEQDRQAWRAWFGAYSEPVKPFGSRG